MYFIKDFKRNKLNSGISIANIIFEAFFLSNKVFIIFRSNLNIKIINFKYKDFRPIYNR